jgi:ribosome maturation factor RimP
MGNNIDKIKSEIAPILKDMDAELFDIHMKYSQDGIVLTVLVDTQKGISIGECAVINKRIAAVLTEKDLIKQKYILDVSSPGLDRPLGSQRDFSKAAGEIVDIWLLSKVNERDFVSGIVRHPGECNVEIEEKNGNRIVLPYDKINKAKRVF